MCIVPLAVSVVTTHIWDIWLQFMITRERTYIYNGTMQQIGILLQVLHHNFAALIVIGYLPRVRGIIVTSAKKITAVVKPQSKAVEPREIT